MLSNAARFFKVNYKTRICAFELKAVVTIPSISYMPYTESRII